MSSFYLARGFTAGRRNVNVVLTAGKVRRIRKLHAEGQSVTSLAREYGVSWTTIRNVVTRTTWSHVT